MRTTFFYHYKKRGDDLLEILSNLSLNFFLNISVAKVVSGMTGILRLDAWYELVGQAYWDV